MQLTAPPPGLFHRRQPCCTAGVLLLLICGEDTKQDHSETHKRSFTPPSLITRTQMTSKAQDGRARVCGGLASGRSGEMLSIFIHSEWVKYTVQWQSH